MTALAHERERTLANGEDGRRAAAWLVGPAVLSASLLTLAGDHDALPELRAAYLTYMIAAPVLIGLAWWMRRPANRFGSLLVLFGFAAWPLALQSSASPLLFTLGVVGEIPLAFLTFYLCLAFPRGRLESLVERRLMGAWGVTLAVAWLPFLLLLPRLQGATPLSSCLPQCPNNVLQVASLPESLFAIVTPLGIIITVVFAAVIVGIQLGRLATSSTPQRRARWPATMATLVLLTAFSAYFLARGLVPVESAVLSATTWVYMTAQILFPLGFLAVLLRADLFAGRAARKLTESLAGIAQSSSPASPATSPSVLRDSLANALGDPELRLGLWDSGGDRYVGSDGRELAPDRVTASQMWLPIDTGGRSIAGIFTDEALASEADLLATASAATVLALREERDLEDVMALRAEVVSATDSERQRLARDLHDSAQQRLVALRVRIGLAVDQLDGRPEEQEVMQRLGAELDGAIDDLRDVARRFLNPYVLSNGVAAAIRSVTSPWPIKVIVDDAGLGRHSAPTELAVYNCCLEALQNSLEHGGKGVTTTVRLTDSNGALAFSVVDDGVGFDPATTQPGAGLLAVADRAALGGGSSTVSSTPGRGVSVVGWVPDQE